MGGTDREWVMFCLDGRPEAFERLVERYQAALVSYLSGRLGSRDRGEEAAQETFVRSFFALKDLRNPEAFCSWLFGIADRVAREARREGRRAPAAEVSPDIPARTRKEGDSNLQRAIACLAAPYREAVLLRYYSGLSCAEVAQRLNVPLGTVTKRLSRAHEMLRGRLERIERGQCGSEGKR